MVFSIMAENLQDVSDMLCESEAVLLTDELPVLIINMICVRGVI